MLTQSNSFKLTGKIGRRPTDGELYMAHFMGVGGAAKLISNAEDNPQASGARLFPNAAAANRSIFYDRSGRARSVSEVYSVLTSRYASAANSPATRTAMASVGDSTPARCDARQRGAGRTPIDNAAYLSSFPGCPRGHAGRHRPRRHATNSLAADRSDLPFAVSGRRTNPAGLAGGSGIVGQLFVADLGRASNPSRPRVSNARSVQRPPAPRPLDLFSDSQRRTFSS